MSLAELRVKIGRKPITVVELDLEGCSLTYGTAPCTAAIGSTGTAKCYNTFKTCQDTAHFTAATRTFRFTSASSFLPIGEQSYPCISSVKIAPTQLDPKGFSVSGTAEVVMQDFEYHDRGLDPYYAERPNPKGTFWGKLRARIPYLTNRVMRIKTGYIDANRTIYERTETYFIDRIEGPNAAGVVRIIGKDILRFTDADKSEAPKTSRGRLSANISNSATSLTMTPAGIGAEYPTSGTVRINDELITFSGRTSDTLTGLTRGTDGSLAVGHALDDSVQLCIRYTAQSVPAILNDLLVNYAGISSGYIPLTDWNAEAAIWIGSLNPSTVISEPTKVKELVEDLLESSGTGLWWDAEAAKLQFKVITPQVTGEEVPVLTDARHFLKGSLSVKDLEKERISRAIMHIQPRTQVAEIKKENMRAAVVIVDAPGESANAYGSPATREIVSRWVGSVPLASSVLTRLMNRYKETPRQISFSLDAKDGALKTGDVFDVQTRLIQAADGSPALVRFIVLEVTETVVGTTFKYEALQISAVGGGVTRLIAPNATPDWTASNATQKGKYMYISNNAGVMSDLSPGPLIS